jgi:glyoxylase-like metal-dependent hydrolase (beta-lactamase superfamily II)
MHEKAEVLRPFFRASCEMHGFAEKEMLEKYTPLNRMEFLQVGKEKLRILLTPGHSLCGVSLASDTFVITGDTLFKGDMGRYDLPGSSLPQLYASLKKLAALPDDLDVLPGHLELSTLALEKRENEYLKTAFGQEA